MRLKNNVAAKAIAAGLSFALAMGGVTAPATMALAEDSATSTTTSGTAPTGSITISENANLKSDSSTIQGYQIFTADVADQTVGAVTQKVVSNVDWASKSVENIVQGKIKAADSTYVGTTAQDAANWLSKKASGIGSNVTVTGGDVFAEIAKALRESGITPENLTPGTPATLSSGYWVFVTATTSTEDTIYNTSIGTSPLFQIVGGSAITVNQKSNLPTVTKSVKNDAAGSTWSSTADSQIGQQIQYKLTGTVSDVIGSYDTYYYQFYDNLGEALTADTSNIKVAVSNDNGATETEVRAADYTTALDSSTNTMTVTINDLKTVKDTTGADISINKDSIVNVYYNASLNSKAKVASSSNDNTVTLTYSNNPGTNSTGSTVPATARDYTFGLMIYKVDSRNDGKALPDAKFTIQATGADEGAGTQYVQSDGTLGTSEYEFKTGSDGSIYVKGLDAGTYTVKETSSPSGYSKVDDFTFTITPVYTADGSLTEVTAGTNNAISTKADVLDGGVIQVTVMDNPGVNLPLSGQAGVTITWIAGGAVLALGITHLVRSRKRDENNAE